MSNEELVAGIQAGKTELMEELWGQVEKYVMSKASKLDFMLAKMQNRSYNSKTVTGVLEQGDFCNAGYLALVKAVESYNPQTEVPFLAWFIFYLKTAFAEATGYRTVKGRMEPIRHALSLDAPLGDDPDGDTLAAVVADPRNNLDNVEELIWREQLRDAVAGVMQELEPEQAKVLYHRFWKNQTYTDAAGELGITDQNVRTGEARALRRLRHGRYIARLKPFYNFNYYGGTGLGAFRATGMSVQERHLVIKEESREREDRRRQKLEGRRQKEKIQSQVRDTIERINREAQEEVARMTPEEKRALLEKYGYA
mgnify:CR=1 FL=1